MTDGEMNRPGSPSVIAKAVAVAEALTEHRRLSRIAQVTGLPISTVHQILQELVTQGGVREGEERDYMLGPGLLRLAGRAADDSDLCGRPWPCWMLLLITLNQARSEQEEAIRQVRAVMGRYEEVASGEFWLRDDR
jgi:hypothetical protein